jgi:pimeloyl-ACP methyl ester carboxylesterase
MTTPSSSPSLSHASGTAALIAAVAAAVATISIAAPQDLVAPQRIAAAEELVAATPQVAAAAWTPETRGPLSRTWTITYTAHNGAERTAEVIVPASYGPSSDSPPLPLVISPHGRAGTGRSNARYWGDLPGLGRFAVVNPDGMGRSLRYFSYGYEGQIDDLARMPELLSEALPWLRIDRRRVFALGSSMGGQETLLLVARHPEILAGAAAMDSVTDLTRRYTQLPAVPCDQACLDRYGEPRGVNLQSVMRRELGGTPAEVPAAYAARSALSLANEIAASRVPLQVWWSREDHIVTDQEHQSEALFSELRRLDSCAPISAYAGHWAHSAEMRATALLPLALAEFGILRADLVDLPATVTYTAAPTCA